VCVETEPGDLTVHDGRLWHRVARSQYTGRASLRRSMYLPYLTGPYEPKSEDSPTPGIPPRRRVAPQAPRLTGRKGGPSNSLPDRSAGAFAAAARAC
jgi:hypothetical protein